MEATLGSEANCHYDTTCCCVSSTVGFIQPFIHRWENASTQKSNDFQMDHKYPLLLRY